MADDLQDTGPAGGNPNATRSNPNFPDSDGSDSDSGGGDSNDSDSNDRNLFNEVADRVTGVAQDAVDAGQRTAEEILQDENRQTGSSTDTEPDQDQIDQDLAEQGAEGVDNPAVPNDQEEGQRNTGPGNKAEVGPFPDKGPAGSNPNVARGQVNLPDVDGPGDLTDEAADGTLTRSEVEAETRDIEYQQANTVEGIQRVERRQGPLGSDPNRQRVPGIEQESGRVAVQARRLEERVLRQSDALDSQQDVRVIRDNGRLATQLTPEAQDRLEDETAEGTAFSDDGIRIDESGDVDLTDQGQETLAREQAAAVGANITQRFSGPIQGAGQTGADVVNTLLQAEQNAREQEARLNRLPLAQSSRQEGRGTSDENLEEAAQASILNQLEDQTGANLSEEDVEFTREDGQIQASLSDEGEEAVARQNAPFQNTAVEGLFEAGAETRVEFEQFQEPIGREFFSRTPDDPLPGNNTNAASGVAGAALAGVAAPEPVSTGTGALILGGLAGGALIADANRRVDLGDGVPTAQEQTELEVPEDTTGGELETPDREQRAELEVPEETTTLAPEELGIPRAVIQDGNAEISGPDGTEINDDGEIIIPLGTTQVARQTRFEDEEEEEETDDEKAEEEEDEVVVEVPDELLPDEEVTIGEPEETTETEETTEAEEQSEEEELEPIELPEQRQAEQDAEPDETQADEGFGEQVGETGDTRTAEGDTDGRQSGTGAFPGIIGGGATSPTLPPALQEQQEQAEDVAQVGPQDIQTPATASRQADAAADAVAQGDLVGDQVVDAAATRPAQAQVPALTQQQVSLNQQLFQFESPAVGPATAPQTATENVNENRQERVFYEAPFEPPSQRKGRLPFPDLEADSDDFEDFGGEGNAPILTDFFNPVGGELIETPERIRDESTFPGLDF
jgi:hypothetical protein